MAVKLLPVVNGAPFIDASGNPLSGGKIYTYTAGSSTPETTYTTSAGNVANANPIILDSGGYPATGGSVVEVWGTSGVSYKLVLKTSADVTVWTRDNISSINDTTVSQDQWQSGPTPTYISATSFSLVGDQTSAFQVGRRVKTTNSGGTIYSTISASAFGAVTTVTVVNDSGTLDSGLSAVSYGLLSATSPSAPLLTDAYPIVSGSADKTKKIRFEIDGLTTATTRVITVPDADFTLNSAASATAAGVVELLTQAEYDAGADTTRAPTASLNRITLATQQASTSGTSIDFTGIPAGTRRITVMFNGVSTNGTGEYLVQLGDAGGIENSGYLGASSLLDIGTATVNYTSGFGIRSSAAATLLHGSLTLSLENAAAFTWTESGVMAASNAAETYTSSGRKSLTAELDRVRITTTNGTDTFDAGVINVSYER